MLLYKYIYSAAYKPCITRQLITSSHTPGKWQSLMIVEAGVFEVEAGVDEK